MEKYATMYHVGSVYENPETEKDVVVYRVGKFWIAESNDFDLEEITKRIVMQKVKGMGYTKFVGYESL